MVYFVLAVLVTVTAAATVWLVRTRAQQENDPDSGFWYAFGGLCVLLPMILIPALTNNLLSIGLFALAAASAIATHTALRRHQSLAADAGHRARLNSALAAAAVQHDALITQWSRYELDPGATIDFPTMTDVRIPETSALIRAVAAAARFRPADLVIHGLDIVGSRTSRSRTLGSEVLGDDIVDTQALDTDDGVANYQRAVTELAAALATAEHAARCCREPLLDDRAL